MEHFVLIDYSYFLLTICFCTTCLAIAAFSWLTWNTRLRTKMSAICTMVSALLGGSFYLFLINHDILYHVYKNSSNDLPSATWYRLFGPWSSHLLWPHMTVFTNLAIWTVADNRHLLPYISGTLLDLSWMYFEAMTSSNPFRLCGQFQPTALVWTSRKPLHEYTSANAFSGYSASAIPSHIQLQLFLRRYYAKPAPTI